MQTKKQEFAAFAIEVIDHIENYVIPQHGEYPDAMIDGFSIADIKAHLVRYADRIGCNARVQAEAERECMKIAHYACLLLSKLRKGKESCEEEPREERTS